MVESIPSIDIEDLSAKLKIELPDAPVILLPRRLEAADRDGLVFEDETDTLQKVLSSGGVPAQRLDAQGRFIPSVEERSDLTSLPALFFAVAQDPNVVAFAINLLSSYVFEILRGKRSGAEVQFDVYVQDAEQTVGVRYRGTAEGLKDIPAAIEAAKKR